MGKKRKHSDSSDRLMKRIKKLEKKLRKRGRRSYSSSSSSRSESPVQVHYCSDVQSEKENEHPDCNASEPLEKNENHMAHTSLEFGEAAVDNDASEHIEVINLDEDILTLFGDAPKDKSPVGKDIHNDIAKRLEDVLQIGLKKEQKEKITEEYPIPGNCLLFKAPMLNAEVKAATSDMLQKKDSSLAARQGQIGVALTALTSAMDILITEKSEKSQALLKHISDASRLLCDSHHIDTKMRRNFLISSLNNKLKDMLKETKRDQYLFGEELSEKLKATKAITKSSQDLRSFKPKIVVTKNAAASSVTGNLNWKHPQSTSQNAHRKPTTAPYHRSAGPSTAHRGELARKMTSSRASKTNAHYKQRKGP